MTYEEYGVVDSIMNVESIGKHHSIAYIHDDDDDDDNNNDHDNYNDNSIIMIMNDETDIYIDGI